MDALARRVLVTGAAGRLGAAVIRRLSGRYSIVATDHRRPSPSILSLSEFLSADMRLPSGVEALVRRLGARYGGVWSGILHLAETGADGHGDDGTLEAVNIRATERLLDEARRLSVAFFFFRSTVFVHKSCEPGERIDENWPLRPQDAYAKSRLKAEEYIRQTELLFPAVIGRFPPLYEAAAGCPELARDLFAADSRSGTGGAARQTFLHRDDAAAAIEAALEARGRLRGTRAVLFGENEAMTVSERRAILSAALIAGGGDENVAARVHLWKRRARAGWKSILDAGVPSSDESFVVSSALGKRLFGWKPHHALRTSLPKIAAAYMRSPETWATQGVRAAGERISDPASTERSV